MTEADSIQLAIGIIESATLTGVIVGFVLWFFARPDKAR